MKIRTHLRMNIALAVIAPLLIGALLLFSYQYFSRSLQESAEISILRQDINELNQLTAEFCISPSPRLQQQILKKHDHFSRRLQTMRFDTDAENAMLQSLVQHNQGLLASFIQIQQVLQARAGVRDQGDQGGLLTRLQVQLIDQLQHLRGEAVRLSALVDLQLADRHRQSGLLTLGAVALIASLLLGTALVTRRRLGRPLAAMEKGIRRIGAGDLEVRLVPQYDDELGALATAFNAMVQVRHEAEQQLQASEVKYRTLVENLPQRIFLKNSDLSYVSCNDAYARDLGIRAEQITGRSDYDFFPAALADKYRRDDLQVLESGVTIETEEPYQQGGEEFWVSTIKTPVRDEQGTAIGLLGVFWDVTARKKDEARIARLAAILENSPDYVAMVDREGRLTWVNPAGLVLLGYPPGQAPGHLDLAAIHPAPALDYVRDVALPTADRNGVWSGETTMLTRDGSELPIWKVIVAHQDEKGSTSYYSMIGRDLSERKAREEEIHQLNRDLEQRVEERTAALTTTVADLEREVVERLRAERALKESEALYRLLVENIDLGITLIDADFRIQMTNATVGRLLDTPAADFIHQHCYRAFEKRAAVCPHCPGKVAMETGQAAEVETHALLDDGRTIHVRNRAFPVHDETGKATGFIEVIEDITERRRFENQLAETRRQLEALMDNLPGMAYRCRNDADWTMEFVSQGCLELTGYPATELVGNQSRSYASLIHPDDRELVWLQVQEAISDREPFSLEYRVITADGAVRDVWEKGSAVFSADGDLQALEGFIMDVSSRKAAEDALRASEERLRRAVLDAPFPIMLHAEDGEVLLLSRAWCDISGYSLQEIPTISDWTERAYGERKPLVREFIEQLYGIRERIHDGEFEVMTKSGLTRTWDFSSAPLGRTADGRRTVISMAADVTERKQAEQALARTVDDLQRSNQELEQFAYVASHDLQEPLRMVGSYVQLLARRYRGRLDNDADEFIDYAVEGATRMQRLINDLLAFSRAGRQAEPLLPVDCNRILETVEQNLKQSIEESGATLKCDPLPEVLGVASQLTQVFQNLVANAIKFHGEEPPLVEVKACRKGADVLFSVHDNGIGIEPQYFQKIFVIFQRLHGKSDFPGTGIGLSVTKKIIEQHGGRIWIESSPGAGTTFFFTLRGAK